VGKTYFLPQFFTGFTTCQLNQKSHKLILGLGHYAQLTIKTSNTAESTHIQRKPRKIIAKKSAKPVTRNKSNKVTTQCRARKAKTEIKPLS